MVTDLSTRHELIADLISLPKTAAAWNRYKLTDEQVAFYHQQGYLAGVRILNEDQIAQLRAELIEFFDPNHPGHELWYEYHTNESTRPDTILFHALGAWRIRPGFHDVLWHPAFTVAASQLLGGAVRFWHDQLFCKPARHGGEVIWHQDYSYWTRTKPMAHLTCWIGLDDSTRENGCVHYVPRSHKWNLLPREDFTRDMDTIRDYLTGDQLREFQPVPIELKKGEASFHHPLMVHGSFANTSGRPRRAAVINVIRDGVWSDSDRPLQEKVAPIPRGEKLSGQFFPLLYDPNE